LRGNIVEMTGMHAKLARNTAKLKKIRDRAWWLDIRSFLQVVRNDWDAPTHLDVIARVPVAWNRAQLDKFQCTWQRLAADPFLPFACQSTRGVSKTVMNYAIQSPSWFSDGQQLHECCRVPQSSLRWATLVFHQYTENQSCIHFFNIKSHRCSTIQGVHFSSACFFFLITK
jgi:hypothetical protein